MAEPRKIFRIEEAAASRLGEQVADAQAPLRHTELMQEIASLRAILAAMADRPAAAAEAPRNGAAARLTSELNLIAGAIGRSDVAPLGETAPGAPMTRIAH